MSARELPALVLFLALIGMTPLVRGQGPGSKAASPAVPRNPVVMSAESVEAGKKVFDKYCKFCHGPDAKGNGPLAPQGTHPPDLTDATWVHGATDGEIYTNIRDGIGPKMDMKSFKSRLTDKEMWSVVNYLRSLGPQTR